MLIERALLDQIRPYMGSKEAIVVTGMRRVGKTSLLKLIYDGLKTRNKLFLDMENPVNQKHLNQKNFDMIVNNLRFLGLDTSKKAYLFLDEIQLVKNLPHIVKYLMDTYKIKFFLTGSVNFYLKNFFTETLAGRKFLFELFPLSFEEFIKFKGETIHIPKEPENITEPIAETLNILFEEYMNYGGFPDVVLKESIEGKKKYIEDIFTSYYQMEILRLGDFRKNKVVRDLMLILMERVGTKLDVSRLAQELGISRITLNEYLSFLEGSYFLHLVRPYTTDDDSEIKKMPKVYICDSGILNHFARVSKETLFKNTIFNILKNSWEVNYYEKKSGYEIDFIINKTAINTKTLAIQQDLSTIQKENLPAGIKRSFIISQNYTEKVADKSRILYGYNIEQVLN